jgi:hypothetical protein
MEPDGTGKNPIGGAVRQYGVLSFFYASDNEQMNIDYARVRKPDGSVIDTPDSNVVDVATELNTALPTYIDLRQKQMPVKALAAGDQLEYSVHSSQRAPEFIGQFRTTQISSIQQLS